MFIILMHFWMSIIQYNTALIIGGIVLDICLFGEYLFLKIIIYVGSKGDVLL